VIKVQILTTCSYCNGEAYLHVSKPVDRYRACPACNGSGESEKWVSLQEFSQLLNQASCPHADSSLQGNFHFSAGDVWDDVAEVCHDCGANLDKQTIP